MNTRFYLPASQVKDFTKLCEKTKKQLEGFTYTLGEPHDKIFRHVDCEQKCLVARWHTVCDCQLTMPDINDWTLLVSYEQGMTFISDETKKLELKNPEHGMDYGRCDICGHRIKKSFVILNKVTGEELQVGSECLGKFGLKGFLPMYKFTTELYRVYAISYATDDEYGDVESCPSWVRNHDKLLGEKSIERTTMMKAAKMVYDKDGGAYFGGHCTTDRIQKKINFNEPLEVSDEYVNKACEYTLANPTETEFGVEMNRVAKNFYCKNDDALYAFFIVKSYERYLESLTRQTLPVGTGVHVVDGHVVQITKTETYYGDVFTHEIKTSTGLTVYKTGVLPISRIEANGKFERTTSFYSTVKFVSKYGKMYLDRALKRPKKGVQYTEL